MHEGTRHAQSQAHTHAQTHTERGQEYILNLPAVYHSRLWCTSLEQLELRGDQAKLSLLRHKTLTASQHQHYQQMRVI